MGDWTECQFQLTIKKCYDKMTHLAE
jgi:hypothetical protein